ncbi:MAG: ATP-dependent helicase [Mycobacteriales bacterium]
MFKTEEAVTVAALSRRPVSTTVALDVDQRAVVEHRSGPLLVLAGPGTGKTTAIVEAVARRIRRGSHPESLLVLTFGRRAAAQLRARICARLDLVTSAPLALTVHAYAFGLLRRVAQRQGSPPPRLLSGPEAELTVHRLLCGDAEEGGLNWPETLRGALRTRGFARELTDFLARAAERGLSTTQLATLGSTHGRPDWVAAAGFAARWADIEALHPQGAALSYAELISRASALLADPVALREEQARIRSVFVDEYQDTDPGQELLLQRLVGGGGDLVAVGDPDQAIYGFRGADVHALLDFPHRFPCADGSPAPVMALRVSRRLGSTLLTCSRRVSQHLPAAPGVGHRQLIAAAGTAPGDLEVCIAASVAEQAAWVADILRRAHLQDGLPWASMAVLVRSAVQEAPPLRRALAAAGVPVRVPGEELPLGQEPASRALLLALRAAVDPDRFDEESAIELLTGPLGRLDLLELRRLRRAYGTLAPTLVKDLVDVPASLARVAGIVAAARGAADAGVHSALWAAWEQAEVAAVWEAAALAGGSVGQDADRALDAVVALFAAADLFSESLPGAGPGLFVDELASQEIPGGGLFQQTPVEDLVRLSTVHRAKGLEWELVVVAGVQEGSWPDLRAAGSVLDVAALAEAASGLPVSREALLSVALAEERRLFYVAVTRARRRLVVTAVAGGGDDSERPSRFIEELLGQAVAKQDHIRPARPLNLAALVGELRSVVCDPTQSQSLQDAAACELAGLAEQGVRGADPAGWYPLMEFSDLSPLAAAGSLVRVSPSAVELFDRCSLRWFLERVVCAQEAPGAPQLVGSLVHAVAATVGAAQLSGTAQPTREELGAMLDDAWRRVQLGAPWYAERLKAEARAAVDRFLAWQAVNPRRLLAVEEPFKVSVGTALLDGRVDRLEVDAEGRLVVVDLKTASSPVSQAELGCHAQLGMYQLATARGAFAAGAAAPGGAELVQLGRAALAGGARVQRQPALGATGDPGWADALLARVAGGMAGARFAATPGAHCRSCPVRVACPGQPEGLRVGDVRATLATVGEEPR